MTGPADDRPELDTRFALANERTLLAWIRTALTLLAAAGGATQLDDVPGRTGLAALLAVAGVAAAIAGGLRFDRTATALRSGQPPLSGRGPVALAVAVAVIGTVLLVAVLVR